MPTGNSKKTNKWLKSLRKGRNFLSVDIENINSHAFDDHIVSNALPVNLNLNPLATTFIKTRGICENDTSNIVTCLSNELSNEVSNINGNNNMIRNEAPAPKVSISHLVDTNPLDILKRIKTSNLNRLVIGQININIKK